ncbi:hypothetical protein [Actinomycetospora flava]|uniref:Integral membrane protein n=1 Tax=Actinomycetospora flava TaxID=3129232 RepID=A0ABU8M114_9PSEU
MGVSTASFVTTVVVGIVITVVVGVLLRRIAREFLAEVYGDRSLSSSLNYLLVTLYYLFALGLLTLVASADLGLAGVQLVVVRIGIFLLVLGGVYGLTVLALERARRRQREQTLEEDFRGRG